MKNKNKIILIISVLLLVALIWFFVFKKKKDKYDGKYVYTDYTPANEDTRHTWLIKDGMRINWQDTGITSDEVKAIRTKVSYEVLLSYPK